MNRILVSVNVVLLAATAAVAQMVIQGPTTAPAESKKTIPMQLRPAAAPRPALRYQFLPEYIEQTPGNAEPLYNTAIHLLPKSDPEMGEQVSGWLDVPLQDLPREEVRQALDEARNALSYTRLASRREWCRWDPPLRAKGDSVMLPELSSLRALGRLVALKARLEMAEGHLDAAVEDLKTGFALARHTTQSPTLINSLVGLAIADLMAKRVQELIVCPDAPNVYWALTDLPSPLIGVRDAMQTERNLILLSMPRLQNIQNAEMSPQQWQDLLTSLNRLSGAMQTDEQTKRPGWDDKLATAAMAVKLYPQAKQHLVSHGQTKEQVDRMPAPQAILLYMVESYATYRDELFKWFALPYWQAHGELKRVERELAREAESSRGLNPMIGMLPSLSGAYLRTTQLDRQIAALRCIEAIRLHAAASDGRLPASLDDITAVPVPKDPITGRSFVYKLGKETAILEGPAPAGESAKYCVHYELTLVK